MPTHQIIQMNVGEMFSIGRSVPMNPATISSTKIATESTLTAADAIRLDSTCPATGTRSRFRRGYSICPPLLCTNIPSTTKESATTATAPIRK